MTRLRCAVVGAGYLGRFHAQKYAALANCELVGIADPSAEARERLRAELGVPGFADHRELLGRVDAVSIATPTALHHAVARDFLQAGVHVLVEKPITATAEEARELIAIAAAQGRVLQVGHLERFNPVILAVASELSQPALHRVEPARAVQAARHRRFRRARPHDPRHRPDRAHRALADRLDRRDRRARVHRRDRHRQCAHPVRERLRCRRHGEPHQPEGGAETARVPGRCLPVDRPAAEAAHDRAQAGGVRGGRHSARWTCRNGVSIRATRCWTRSGRSSRRAERTAGRSFPARTACARSRPRCASRNSSTAAPTAAGRPHRPARRPVYWSG